jgi:hypothetical protein
MSAAGSTGRDRAPRVLVWITAAFAGLAFVFAGLFAFV